jgi:hypothetical protein
MSASIKIRTVKIPDELTSRELRPLLEAILTDITALTAAVNALRTDYNAHVHGGVTVGAGNTGTTTATTATAVTPTLLP